MCEEAPAEGLATLKALAAASQPVALLIADLRMPTSVDARGANTSDKKTYTSLEDRKRPQPYPVVT